LCLPKAVSYADCVREEFDAGERGGLYLKPMVHAGKGSCFGGELVDLDRAGASATLQALDVILRETPAAIVTPPIYASDALEGSNPLFAVRALREFVWICLAECRRRIERK
jgi:hypothetical protein